MIVVLAFAFPRSEPSNELRLTFTAAPVKASFKQGEKVLLRFEIKNEGHSDVLVSPAFILNYDIYLDVRNRNGSSISWCGINARRVFLGDKFVTLGAGKSLGMEREVSCDDSHQSGYVFPSPGEYSVKATYRFPVSPKKLRDNPRPVPFASGPYESRPAHFTITAKTN
ncbi:MAG: hypothetical protein WCE61_01950 [Candidatus Acidiferrum sp.]